MNLKYSFSALCKIEELENRPFSEVLPSLTQDNMSFRVLRNLYIAGRVHDKTVSKSYEYDSELDKLVEQEGLQGLAEAITKALFDSGILGKTEKK